jgi:hypothetical protein
MGRTPEPGGDYGYDEVHQDLPVGSGAAVEGAPPPSTPAQDPGGDYGYDEAHDF